MPRPSRVECFLGVARVLATRSTCIRRQVGCVLTDEKGIILSTGYNGVSQDQPHCLDIPCGGASAGHGEGLELCEAVHAEQNALIQCPRHDHILAAYLTDSPCLHCVKMLLNTTCREIYYINLYDQRAVERWVSAGRKIEQTTSLRMAIGPQLDNLIDRCL
jgi:dCMP deaminase